MVTPYPALLYPIVEALPPRHAAVRRHPAASGSSAAGGAGAGAGAVPFASLFDIGAIGSPGVGGRGREESGGGSGGVGGGGSGGQDSGQVGGGGFGVSGRLCQRTCCRGGAVLSEDAAGCF